MTNKTNQPRQSPPPPQLATVRVPIMMTPAEAAELDNWQFSNRQRNRTAAIKALISLGYKASAAAAAQAAAKAAARAAAKAAKAAGPSAPAADPATEPAAERDRKESGDA